MTKDKAIVENNTLTESDRMIESGRMIEEGNKTTKERNKTEKEGNKTIKGEKELVTESSKIIVEEKLRNILDTLDRLYGVTKEGFFFHKDWQLLMAIMLSAQSTDKQVDEVLPGLWQKFPDLETLVDAPLEDVEKAIMSIGLYKNKAANMKKCAGQLLNDYEGKVPDTIEELVKLAGVGRKTATLFLADAYGIPGVTVDTHVFRISHRLGWAVGNNPVKVEQELMKLLPVDHWNRINFQLIYHGRAVCTARKCRCESCGLEKWCEKAGVENQFK